MVNPARLERILSVQVNEDTPESSLNSAGVLGSPLVSPCLCPGDVRVGAISMEDHYLSIFTTVQILSP